MIVKYEVRLLVEVDCFDEADALEVVEENFGIGSGLGLEVLECEYRDKGYK